ncbi:MAG TPA: malto-oligosyltrehalose synthase [Bryobacteraceae bacterium]|nr:malto-oligosyltrehalose synthase [Bryobacteraceae bacterium]
MTSANIESAASTTGTPDQPVQFRIPVSTYRVQFNQHFRFLDAVALVPYLHDLGITDLYASPWFRPRRGSLHGYDIVNPMQMNSELGTDHDLEELMVKLEHYGMGVVLDVVPNHMAASTENPWWRDVLENGPSSEYSSFFDIDWHPLTGKAAVLQQNRVLLPILGALYGKVLESQELVLKIDDAGLFVRYYDYRLPLDPKTWRPILEESLSQLRNTGAGDSPGASELAALAEAADRLPDRNITAPEQIHIRNRDKESLKQALWRLYHDTPEITHAVDAALLVLNGSKGDEASFQRLDRILSRQAWRVAWWKVAYEEINYRRFFDVNELVGLKVEVPQAFRARHERFLRLVRTGKVPALRIDHVDGLNDPLDYLRSIQQSVDPRGSAQALYLVVEKILGAGEELPADWPVSGTTGYDFLNALNGVFVRPDGLCALKKIYDRRTGNEKTYAEMMYEAKREVIQRLFRGEISMLARSLAKVAAEDRMGRDVLLSELMEVLVEVTACLPVYRTYTRDFTVSRSDREHIEKALRVARERTREEQLSPAAFEFVRRVLLLEMPEYANEQKPLFLRFVTLWQQFTPPVMAKGLEDTASYRYPVLLSLNEVGGDPFHESPSPDVTSFHQFNQRRLSGWPHSMSATSTHDVKRSEDVRARLNVLSEIPEEWDRVLEAWMTENAGKKRLIKDQLAPDASEEILLYQTLLGVWPSAESEIPEFRGRLKEFLVKALREAKLHSSWITPDEEYENAATDFAEAILEQAPGNTFLSSFLELQQRIAFYGVINALAQVVLKITSPGVPDFYQGTACWTFTLVDPDNRRPVDYRKRIALIESLKRREAEDRTSLLRDLGTHWRNDDLKMYVTYRSLDFRRTASQVFQHGEYIPLSAIGERSAHVAAFCRRRGERWALTVAPRWSTAIYKPERLSSGDWSDTALELPSSVPRRWRNVLTGAQLESDTDRLSLGDLLRELPVALLESVPS